MFSNLQDSIHAPWTDIHPSLPTKSNSRFLFRSRIHGGNEERSGSTGRPLVAALSISLIDRRSSTPVVWYTSPVPRHRRRLAMPDKLVATSWLAGKDVSKGPGGEVNSALMRREIGNVAPPRTGTQFSFFFLFYFFFHGELFIIKEGQVDKKEGRGRLILEMESVASIRRRKRLTL